MKELRKEQKHTLDIFINELVKAKHEFKDSDYNDNIEFYEMLTYAYRNTEAYLKTEVN